MVSVLFRPCHLASIPLPVSYEAGQNHLVAGRRAVLVRKFLRNSAWNRGGQVIRKLAGLGIGAPGLYFAGLPIMDCIGS